MELSEFLLARIAEDEAGARAAQPWMPWSLHDGHIGGPGSASYAGYEAATDFAERHDPARVLAECDAKRRIVEAHPIGEGQDGSWEGRRVVGCLNCTSCGVDGTDIVKAGPCKTLRALALPHADHPDYRPEWRP